MLPAVSVGASLRLVITTSCLNHEKMAPNGRPHAEMKRTAQHDQSAASLRRSRRSQSRVSFSLLAFALKHDACLAAMARKKPLRQNLAPSPMAGLERLRRHGVNGIRCFSPATVGRRAGANDATTSCEAARAR